MLKVKKSNASILKDRNLARRKQARTTVGTFNSIAERKLVIQKNNENGINPELFLNFIPIVQIPEWSQITETNNQSNLKNSISQLETIIQQSNTRISQLQKEVALFVEKAPEIRSQIYSFRGRGLKEYRKTLFIIYYINSLKIKLGSLIIKDKKELIEYCNTMIDVLRRPIDFHDILFSADISGYLNSRNSSEQKILKIKKKLNVFDAQKYQWPQFMPPPDDFALQLIYPTSDTVSIFKEMALNHQTKSIEKIYTQFKEMTDDSEEMEILLDHAFDFGWNKTEFPYLGMKPTKIRLFLNVTPRALNVDFIPHKYMDIKINHLQKSGWPYASVVNIIQSMLFEINPFRMAQIFDSALKEITKCVDAVVDKPTELDFDQIFSIAILCLMASGILEEERVILYISQLSLLDIDDMPTRVGATYAASALNHILSLDEDELVELSQNQ